MKKIFLTIMFLYGVSLYAQTYCVPEFSSGCSGGDNIDSFEIPDANFSHLNTGCSANSYGNYVSQTINLNAGVNYPFSVVHGYDNQRIKAWIDFNNDGTFTDAAPELVAEGTSLTVNNVVTTNSVIGIPFNIVPGNYRMRIAGSYSSSPIPCNLDGFGEAHDYTVAIGAAPSCVAPFNIITGTVGSNSANISWTAPTNIPAVEYEYYLSTSSTTPINSTLSTASLTNTSVSAVISNLIPTTTYYIWLRSVCSATQKSTWSLSTSFTTSCAIIVPNFTYDFANGTDVCWFKADSGNPSTSPSGNYSAWNTTGFLNNGFDGAMKINIFTNSFSPSQFDAWLITPSFNLSAGFYRVKFDYGLTTYGSTGASSLGSDDVVQFVISQDGGLTWSILQTWNATNSPSNTSNQYLFNLVGYTGSNTKFGFYATNGSVADASDTDFSIDNFVVEQNSLATNENLLNENTVKAYPNPFSDVLNISDISKVRSISIVDISGKLIKTIEKPSTTIQLQELKSGIYVVILNMNDGTKQTIKVIKK